MYPQRFEDHRHLGLLLLAAVCLFVPFELALAQGNRDGSVSMLELFGYANLQTRRWVRHNRPYSSQTPELHGRIPADFQLGGRSPAAQSAPLPVAPFMASTQQEVWAKHLGQPVEITNSIGMKQMMQLFISPKKKR